MISSPAMDTPAAHSAEPRRFKFGLACGGTGGHIFPGLATAEALRHQGHEVTLWLAGKDIESAAVQRWDGPKHTVHAKGFQGGPSLKHLGVALTLFRAFRHCLHLMRKDRSDALLAMGSYASVGPVAAAKWLGIPVVLHESNVIPGRVVRAASWIAREVGACFEETRSHLRSLPVEMTGFPLRAELIAAARATRYAPRRSGRFVVMIMGGSRGARVLNDKVMQAVLLLRRVEDNLRIIHIAGPSDAARVREHYERHGITASVHEFVQNMAEVYSVADIAICRAGAATCAELSCFGLPSLLVPFPYAANDHQTENAKAMERAGAADYVREDALEPEWLAEYLDGSMNTPSRLLRISRAAMKRNQAGAAEALAARLILAAAARAPR